MIKTKLIILSAAIFCLFFYNYNTVFPQFKNYKIVLYHCGKRDLFVYKWLMETFRQELRSEFIFSSVQIEYVNMSNGGVVGKYDDSDFSFVIVGSKTGKVHCSKHVPIGSYKLTRAGEVFHGDYHCPKTVDFVLDRSLERKVIGNCKKLHYIQGFAFQGRRDIDYDLNSLCKQKQTKNKTLDLILATQRVIKRKYHFNDALFRSTLFNTLIEQSNLTIKGTGVADQLDKKEYRVHCRGNELAMTRCKSKFRFSLDMENSQINGYVTEKIFTGLLAGVVPVYYGAPDIGKYVNANRFIHCKISDDKIKQFRKMKKDRKFYFESGNLEPTTEELMAYSYDFLRYEINDCVAKIIKVYENRTIYNKMVNEPVFSKEMCDKSVKDYDTGRMLFEYIKHI